jgi:hypothetical protein
MAIIAISVLLLMWNYIVNYKKEKKPTEEVKPLVQPTPLFEPDIPKKALPPMETRLPPPVQHKTYYI